MFSKHNQHKSARCQRLKNSKQLKALSYQAQERTEAHIKLH